MPLKRRIVLLTLALSVGGAFVGTFWKSMSGPLEAQLTNTSIVIDDGDPGFATTGVGWQRFPYELAYQGDMMSPSLVADPTLSATWTFGNLTPGIYKVFVYFKAYTILSSQIPYFLKDGDRTVAAITVNQQTDATGNSFNGMSWTLLGSVSVQGTTLRVVLQRPADLVSNGVIADAARIEKVSTQAQATALPTISSTSATPRTAVSSTPLGIAPSTTIGTSPSASQVSPALPSIGSMSTASSLGHLSLYGAPSLGLSTSGTVGETSPGLITGGGYPAAEAISSLSTVGGTSFIPATSALPTCNSANSGLKRCLQSDEQGVALEMVCGFDYGHLSWTWTIYKQCGGDATHRGICVNDSNCATTEKSSSSANSTSSIGDSCEGSDWVNEPLHTCNSDRSSMKRCLQSDEQGVALEMVCGFDYGHLSWTWTISKQCGGDATHRGICVRYGDIEGCNTVSISSCNSSSTGSATNSSADGSQGSTGSSGSQGSASNGSRPPLFSSSRMGYQCPQNGCGTYADSTCSCDYSMGQQACDCCRTGTAFKCSDPWTCSCQPIQCPSGYHPNEYGVCVLNAVCGDGYLDRPPEVCETNPQQGCPPDRTCLTCKRCGVCGDTKVEGPEECEADFTCGSGRACRQCRCVTSGTRLTANVTATLDIGKADVARSVESITRATWSQTVLPGDKYDVYVWTKKLPSWISPYPCPISYWRVYDGTTSVRPLVIEYGNPLCLNWPGGDKTGVWIRIGQVLSMNATLKVELTPSNLPYVLQDEDVLIRIAKVIPPTIENPDPAPLGVTLIDDGDQGFSESGPYEETTGPTYVLPWSTLDQGQPVYGDDYVDSSYHPTWAFTVNPDEVYDVYVTFRVPDDAPPGNAYDRTYEGRDGLNFKFGPMTIGGSKPPDGPWFSGAKWTYLGNFSTRTDRFSLTQTRMTYGVDAVRLVTSGTPFSSARSSSRSSIRSSSSARSSSSSPRSSSAASSPASSAVSSSARSSSRVSSAVSSQASQCAREGEVLSETDMRQCCAGLSPWYNLVLNASGQCPTISLTMICIRQCGDGSCTLGENECNCEIDCPRPSISSSSVVSSAASSSSAACIAEGQTGPNASLTASCCTGLTRIHSDYVNAYGYCSWVFDTFTCARCGTDGQCGPGENRCNCSIDCSGVTNFSSSARSASSLQSSATSVQWQACPQGDLCSRSLVNNQCAVSDPPPSCRRDGTLSCGRDGCWGDCFTCMWGSSASSASGNSSPTSSVASSVSSAGDASSSEVSSSAPACGNGQLDAGEQCDAYHIDCPDGQLCNAQSCQCEGSDEGPDCGNGHLESGEQCDGADYQCPAGQTCNSACGCVEPPPDSIVWQEVDKPYPPALGSTTAYGMFADNYYIYAAGGQDFWGSTKNVWRSADGKTWELTGLLPQKLSNAAALPLAGGFGAALLGGLYDTNSVVNWAFVTSSLLSKGFESSPTFALSLTRYDGAALSANGKYYFLGGTYKQTTMGGSLLGSLLGYLLGGTTVNTPAYDVIVHQDGGGWAPSGRVPFPVTSANAFALGNRLFIFETSGNRDIYASTTGSSWTKVSSLPALPGATSLLHPVIHKNAVWLIGKQGGSALASSDGIQWKVVNGAYPSAFTPENAVSFRNRLWVLGWLQDYYLNAKTFKVMFSPPFGCGNGIVETGEGCDDGNMTPGDGCASTCSTEPGWVCSHMLWTKSRCSLPRCGNGVVDTADGEQCDDGWQADGDGCSGTCHIEAGWTCVNTPGRAGRESVCARSTTGSSSSTNGVSSRGTSSQNFSSQGVSSQNYAQSSSSQANQTHYCCSNGQCQRSTNVSCPATYDACQLSCTVTNASSASRVTASSARSQTSAASSVAATCGNGQFDVGEECDASVWNFVNPCGYGGTCGSDCRCVASTCGDGNVDGTDQCDDGNAIAGDGCSTSCAVEPGWTCSCAAASLPSPRFSFQSFFASIFSFFTGQSPTPVEVASSCRSVCSRIPNWQASSSSPYRCGNGIREPGEQCEMGIEVGQWTCGDSTRYCDLPPPIGNGTCQCVTNPGFCGDGTLDAGEQCERGWNQDRCASDETCDITTCQCKKAFPGQWQSCPANSGCSAAIIGNQCAFAPPPSCWPGSVETVGTCGATGCQGACRRCVMAPPPNPYSSVSSASSSPDRDINQCIDGLCCQAHYPVLEESPYRAVKFPGVTTVSADDPLPLVVALSPDTVLVVRRTAAMIVKIENGKPVNGPVGSIPNNLTPLALLALDATHAVIGNTEGGTCSLRAISFDGTTVSVGPATPLSSIAANSPLAKLQARCRNIALTHTSDLQFVVAMGNSADVNVRIGTLHADNSLTIGSPNSVNQGTPTLNNPSLGIVLAGRDASQFMLGIVRSPELNAYSVSTNPLLTLYNGTIGENSAISIQQSSTIPVRSSKPLVTMTGNNSLVLAPVEVTGNPNRVGISIAGTTYDIGAEGGLLRMVPMGSDGLLLVTTRRLSNSSYELMNIFAQENGTGGWTFRPVVGCAGPNAYSASTANGPVIEPLDDHSYLCGFTGGSAVGLISCDECQNSCNE